MIALSCNNVNKSFGIDSILENISFSINEGDRVGLVGVNGTGKTTLLKIVAGLEDYDSGDIYFSKGSNVGYLQQNANFQSDKTIIDEVMSVFSHLIEMEESLRELEHNIALESSNNDSKSFDSMMAKYSSDLEKFNEMNGYGYKSEVRGVLKGLGFEEDEFQKPVNVLSGGQKTRVLLSKILLQKPDILLLDEPTNHLDIEAVEWLELFLKQYKGTIVLISHDRYFLDQLVNTVLEIHNKRLRTYNGDYTHFMKQRLVNEDIEKRQYENQQEEIKRQQAVIDKLKSFGREKQVKRARSREKALDKMEVLDRPDYARNKARISFDTQISSGNDVMQVEGLAMGFEEQNLFENINFNIYKHEKVALIGPNGIGKSTLFNLIEKKLEPRAGKINLGTNVNIGYYDQEQEGLDPVNSIIEEIRNENPLLTDTEIRNYLAAFLFTGEDVFKLIESLSGGEKARVALLKLMLSKSNFLLLDEPTNHLDIDSKDVLEEALIDYEGTLFMISHDRYFLNRVSNKILSLTQDGLAEYLGNYDYYLEKKRQAELSEEEIVETTKTKTQIKEERRKEKERQKEEKKLRERSKKIEEEISEIEGIIEDLDAKMCLEEYYSDPQKSVEVAKEKSSLEERLAMLYEEWEEFM